jgi:hypothetical protein
MFFTQCRQISAFCLLALTTEAWRGAESGTLRKTYMLIYPDPKTFLREETLLSNQDEIDVHGLGQIYFFRV